MRRKKAKIEKESVNIFDRSRAKLCRMIPDSGKMLI
jgi:hypothetical protein